MTQLSRVLQKLWHKLDSVAWPWLGVELYHSLTPSAELCWDQPTGWGSDRILFSNRTSLDLLSVQQDAAKPDWQPGYHCLLIWNQTENERHIWKRCFWKHSNLPAMVEDLAFFSLAPWPCWWCFWLLFSCFLHFYPTMLTHLNDRNHFSLFNFLCIPGTIPAKARLYKKTPLCHLSCPLQSFLGLELHIQQINDDV